MSRVDEPIVKLCPDGWSASQYNSFAELKARKRQYCYYRDKPFKFKERVV